ncbi:MAG: phytanoyl-CoA dioxygenase family protein [Armatimonadetes bacterium]|nr:phytanoyl-CoA dioxygenase family protein [Armatimonadota bacterium]
MSQPGCLLSEEQLRQYREEGYTVVRGLVGPEEVAKVRARLMGLLEGEHDWSGRHFQVLDPSRYRNARGGTVPIGVQQPAEREEVFREVADHPDLQSAMSQLLGGPVRRFTNQALIKNAQVDGQSFYHQDSYYWRVEPERGCNTWIALDHVDREAIALGIMPGSHRSWTLTQHEQYFDEPTFHSAETGKAFQRWRIPFYRVDYSREVLLPMSPGDAAFFTNFTWHRAECNRSGEHKCAYAIAYVLEG